MFTIRTITCVLFAGIAMAAFGTAIEAGGQPKLKKGLAPKQPTPTSKLKTYDLQVTSLTIANVAGSTTRYQLKATVKNASASDYNSGGTLVFSRAGHGEPLPDEPGGKVPTDQKWGHEKLGSRAIPALKAGQSTTLSMETNGRGDFYAHIEGVIDFNSQNNRGDASNLLSRPLIISNDFLQSVLGSTVAKTISRLDGPKGSLEIPGLIAKTTFPLPTEAFDVNLGGLLGHLKLSFAVNSINAKSASIAIENGALVFRLEYETAGDEVLVGGNQVAGFIYPNVNADMLKIKASMPISFNKKKQQFQLAAPDVTVQGTWTFNTSVPGLKQALNSMLNGVNGQIKSGVVDALSGKNITDIEWQLNTMLRQTFLVDKFGNTGAIDSAIISGDRIEMKARVPSLLPV